MDWIRIGGDFVAPQFEGAVHLRLCLLVLLHLLLLLVYRPRALPLPLHPLSRLPCFPLPLAFSGALHGPVALPLRLRPLQRPDLLLQPRVRKAQLLQLVLPAPTRRGVEALENVVARSSYYPISSMGVRGRGG
ncbi:hypothetical protein DFH08DRAFT_847078, partial [Mycena albidolilacea]